MQLKKENLRRVFWTPEFGCPNQYANFLDGMDMSLIMLSGHKTKINLETSPLCRVCKIKETPSNYHLECNRFKKEREALLNKISFILSQDKVVPKNVIAALGKQNFSKGGSNREEIEKYITSIKHEF